MKLHTFLLPVVTVPLLCAADEPGHLINENVHSEVHRPQQKPDRTVEDSALISQFKRARGLGRDEILTLYTQRVSCSRRVYSPSGWALDGDGDLRITRVGGGNFEIDFSTFLFMGKFNPFKNGLYYVNTESPRKVMNLESWPEGQSLVIGKLVSLTPQSPKESVQIVPAVDEFRVISDTYPPTFLVREEILAKKKFTLYFICQ